jgi:flagellar motor switch protein FliN
MSADEVRYEELQAGAEPAGDGADLGRLQNVPVELAIEIGRTRMTIGDALTLGPGSLVTIGRLAGDPVDLLVNGRVIARGEVVAIDEELGLRITEIAAKVVDGGGTEAREPRVLSSEESPAGGAAAPFSDSPPMPPAAAAVSVDADPPGDAELNGKGREAVS